LTSDDLSAAVDAWKLKARAARSFDARRQQELSRESERGQIIALADDELLRELYQQLPTLADCVGERVGMLIDELAERAQPALWQSIFEERLEGLADAEEEIAASRDALIERRVYREKAIGCQVGTRSSHHLLPRSAS